MPPGGFPGGIRGMIVVVIGIALFLWATTSGGGVGGAFNSTQQAEISTSIGAVAASGGGGIADIGNIVGPVVLILFLLYGFGMLVGKSRGE